MRKHLLRSVVTTAAALCLTLALAACGGNNPAGNDSPTGGETPTTGQTGASFVIGIGAPITQGDIAFGQGIERGTKLAVQDGNELPEVKALGISFTTTTGDDQSDPKVGTTVANTFASNRDLVGVVGHFNSTVSIAASKVYDEKNIVAISPGSTNPTLTQQGFKSIFRTTATDAVQGPVGAQRAWDLGFKTAAVVNDSSTYGAGLVDEFVKKFESLGGQIVLNDKTQQKQNDFTALATRIGAANADVVYFGGTYAADTGAGSLFSKQLKAGGVTAPVMGGDGLYADAYIELAGNADGDLATCPGLPPDLLPKGAQFREDYAAAFPGEDMAAFDAYAYDAAWSIILATVQVAQDLGVSEVTSPAGRDALVSAVAGLTFDGVTGPVAYDDLGDNTNQAITLYKVVDGAWVPQPE
jgi:branched-chain amino acid transport system substrate-binding protein